MDTLLFKNYLRKYSKVLFKIFNFRTKVKTPKIFPQFFIYYSIKVKLKKEQTQNQFISLILIFIEYNSK